LIAAGSSAEDARKVLAEQTVKAAKNGDARALERLDRWLMPKDRLVPAAKGASASKRAASIVRQLASGELTPHEAEAAMRAVRTHAEANEWQQLADAAEEAKQR
jgi:hypothetical protein